MKSNYSLDNMNNRFYNNVFISDYNIIEFML